MLRQRGRITFVFVLVAVGIASLASGLGTVAGDLIYYSDATHATPVGE